MSLDTDRNQETFVYEDADHNNYLLEKLNTLRKNKQFCDVILQVSFIFLFVNNEIDKISEI